MEKHRPLMSEKGSSGGQVWLENMVREEGMEKAKTNSFFSKGLGSS